MSLTVTFLFQINFPDSLPHSQASLYEELSVFTASVCDAASDLSAIPAHPKTVLPDYQNLNIS